MRGLEIRQLTRYMRLLSFNGAEARPEYSQAILRGERSIIGGKCISRGYGGHAMIVTAVSAVPHSRHHEHHSERARRKQQERERREDYPGRRDPRAKAHQDNQPENNPDEARSSESRHGTTAPYVI